MSDSEQKKLESLVILARMFGIKETLEPMQFVPNEDIVMLIMKWTEECLDISEKDIAQFFESKFHESFI